MKGYRILFSTQENRKVHGDNVGPWILQQARKLGAAGGTMTAGAWRLSLGATGCRSRYPMPDSVSN